MIVEANPEPIYLSEYEALVMGIEENGCDPILQCAVIADQCEDRGDLARAAAWGLLYAYRKSPRFDAHDPELSGWWHSDGWGKKSRLPPRWVNAKAWIPCSELRGAAVPEAVEGVGVCFAREGLTIANYYWIAVEAFARSPEEKRRLIAGEMELSNRHSRFTG